MTTADRANTKPSLVTQDWPPVVGRPGLTQGVYGSRGNLELVACDPSDGMWVGWYNADAEEAHAGAAVGRWSGALRFGRGHRYCAAAITQVPAGPDYLEVVALTDRGEVRRHVWTPDDGFVDHGPIATETTELGRVVALPDGSHRVAVHTSGGPVVLTGHPGPDYPRMTLTAKRLHVGYGPLHDTRLVDAVAHGEHLDVLVTHDGTVSLWCQETPTPVAPGFHGRLARDGESWAVIVRSESGGLTLVVDGETIGPVGDGEAEIAVVHIDGASAVHVVVLREGGLTHRVGTTSASADKIIATQWVDDPGNQGTLHRG